MKTNLSARMPRVLRLMILGAALAAASIAPIACEGPPGPPGAKGDTGDTGEQGLPGDAGLQGETGPQGEAGTNWTPDAGPSAGEGLVFTIVPTASGAPMAIDASGAGTLKFTVTDSAGEALDVDGKLTEGAISVHVALGWLAANNADGSPGQYTSYFTKQVQGGAGMITEPDEDQGGTIAYDAATKQYTYTFGNKITVADGTKTHTVGVWATRLFEKKKYVANAAADFLPAGGAVTVVRDIATTKGCNGCHNPLKKHDGERRDVRICVICHTPAATDVPSGASLDFPEMVHKIHRGKELPSVLAGTPYKLQGDKLEDYAGGYPQDLFRCTACHTGTNAGVWQSEPATRARCQTCHDRTWFQTTTPPAGWTMHGTPEFPAGKVQTSDSGCSGCHGSGAPYDLATYHISAATDPNATVIELGIDHVEKTAPGQTPELVFTVKQNGQPLNIIATPLNSLAVTMAGPTTEFAWYKTFTIQGTGALGTLSQEGSTAGTFRYKLPVPVDTAATGSYGFALEGYVVDSATNFRYAAMNPVAYAPVTDTVSVDRRKIVDQLGCEGCHHKLEAHGGSRQNVQYCSFCHNPNKANDTRAPRFQGSTVEAKSVALAPMIHRIHAGQTIWLEPYVLGSFPAPTVANPAGTQVDFGRTRYPGDLSQCPTCHAGATYLPPLPDTNLPVLSETFTCVTPNPVSTAYCQSPDWVVSQKTYTGPLAAACMGCHNKPSPDVAHIMTNTWNGADACANCHADGKSVPVLGAHLPNP